MSFLGISLQTRGNRKQWSKRYSKGHWPERKLQEHLRKCFESTYQASHIASGKFPVFHEDSTPNLFLFCSKFAETLLVFGKSLCLQKCFCVRASSFLKRLHFLFKQDIWVGHLTSGLMGYQLEEEKQLGSGFRHLSKTNLRLK